MEGLFSGLSMVTFVVAVAALISFICLYIYELPSHHCPFCILQKDYRYVGYLLYVTAIGGGIAGAGVGALIPCRNVASLAARVPTIQRRLAGFSVVMYLLFAAVVAVLMLATDFRLE
jgi:hypothetical protein